MYKPYNQETNPGHYWDPNNKMWLRSEQTGSYRQDLKNMTWNGLWTKSPWEEAFDRKYDSFVCRYIIEPIIIPLATFPLKLLWLLCKTAFYVCCYLIKLLFRGSRSVLANHQRHTDQPQQVIQSRVQKFNQVDQPQRPVQQGNNFCPYCGKPVEPGSHFCVYCGHQLN